MWRDARREDHLVLLLLLLLVVVLVDTCFVGLRGRDEQVSREVLDRPDTVIERHDAAVEERLLVRNTDR